MKHTTESFIKRAKERHGDKFDYSKVKYKGTHERIEVICNECGKSFMVYPCDHIKKGRYVGCPDCTKKHRIEKRSITKEEFIRRAKSIYGDKYDYSNINFVNMSTKIQVFCNKCKNYFSVIPSRHVNKQKDECPYCSRGRREKIKIDKEKSMFLEQSILIYGENEFDYSEINYVDLNTKIKIKCLTCGKTFWTTPSKHLKGQSCCHYYKNLTNKFINMAKEIHGDKFDYSRSKYINSETKIEIFCKRCNKTFWQLPGVHLSSKYGCPQCARELGGKPKLTKDKFISDAKEVHGNDYNYDKVIFPERGYITTDTKVEIVCNRCGKSFWQDYECHVSAKHGCTDCNKNIHDINDVKNMIFKKFENRYKLIDESFKSYTEIAQFIDNNTKLIIDISPRDLLRRTGTSCHDSLGEKLVRTWLNLNHISMSEKVSIKDLLKRSKPVSIDFVLIYKGRTYWIEYHGIQHFMFDPYLSKTKPNYWRQRIRDQKVRIYCRDHNITLIEIPYTYNTLELVSDLLNEIIINGKDPKSIINIKSYFKK